MARSFRSFRSSFIKNAPRIARRQFAADANTQVVKSNAIPDGWMGLDNGPEANKEIADELRSCKTVIWNGPMGVFEMEVS